MKFVLACCVLLTVSTWTNIGEVAAINVLLVPGPLAGSRLALMNYIGSKLAQRNHNVTVFVNDIGGAEYRENNLTYEEVGDEAVRSIVPRCTSLNIEWDKTTSADNVDDLVRLESAWCKAVFSEERVARWNDTIFNVALVDSSANLCVLGMLHLLRVPYVQFLSTTFGMSHPADPAMSSYVPAYGTAYTDKMAFSERARNFIMANVWGKYVRAHYYEAAQEIFDERLGSTDIDLEVISKEASMFLLNSDPTIEYTRPLPPTIVMIGGFHCQQKVALPKDLEVWFSEGSNPAGVVLFALGSVINLRTAPHHLMASFVTAFDRLKPLKFLIVSKFGLDEQIGKMLPENVKLVPWINLQAVLGDVNTRLFISHGGTSSIVEAVCHAMPVLGVPLFEDHLKNLLILNNKGMAEVLSKGNLTADAIVETINQIILEPGYKDAALRQAILLKDQPLNAINRAIYWIEYVARHGGTSHLRCAALDLSVAARYQLDVVAVLVGVPAAVCGGLVAVLVLCRAGRGAGTGQHTSEGQHVSYTNTSTSSHSLQPDPPHHDTTPKHHSTPAAATTPRRRRK